MAPKPSQMRLTPELVARVLSVDDSLPQPFTAPSDADHDDTVRAILAPAPSGDEVWLFALDR